MSSLAVTQLTDTDLAEKLKEHGIFTGPVTATTRPFLERKLNQKVNGISECNEEVGFSGTGCVVIVISFVNENNLHLF